MITKVTVCLLWAISSCSIVNTWYNSSVFPFPLDFLSTKQLITTTKKWQWSDINPSRDLSWSSCFEGFQCARLDVPLDWLDPSEDKRAIIAVIKLPAKDQTNYKGTVFTNPGGPGGSGVSTLKRSGRFLQQIVGDNHDIISFDPRGIGRSTPLVKCCPSAQNGKIWSLQDVGVVDSHPGVIFDAYARSSAISGVCASASDIEDSSSTGHSEILSFVSTTSVARDMLEIMNKAGIEKLRYWGFSYGTFLGGIFASMWPEKVERLVSDGNVDYVEWSSCSHVNFLHDADKVMAAFYYYCHAAGPSACALFSPDPTKIETRLEAILLKLKTHPVVVLPGERNILPEIVSYSSIKRLISAALYRPILLFPSLARVLAALEDGDGTAYIDLITAQGMHSPFPCDCNVLEPPSRTPDEPEETDDASRAIMCTDGGEMSDTPEKFAEYASSLQEQSKAAGAVNILFRISCVGWKPKAKWRFSGPFGGNTSFPILFVGNKADNVTPLRSARNNAQKFGNSVVLVQDSFGHTSLTAPSKCTASHVRNYFQDGKLPDENTLCRGDIYPFDTLDNEPSINSDEANTEQALLGLMHTIDWGHMGRL